VRELCQHGSVRGERCEALSYSTVKPYMYPRKSLPMTKWDPSRNSSVNLFFFAFDIKGTKTVL